MDIWESVENLVVCIVGRLFGLKSSKPFYLWNLGLLAVTSSSIKKI